MANYGEASFSVMTGMNGAFQAPQLELEDGVFDYSDDPESLYYLRGEDSKSGICRFEDVELGLNKRIVESLIKAGLKSPTLIQRLGMPQIMGKLDVMCCSNTGTGKTATYLVPLINLISREAVCHSPITGSDVPVMGSGCGKEAARCTPRGLILVPTRELALQISKDAGLYGRSSGVNSAAVIGGRSLGFYARILKNDISILVSTPGKLIDMLTNSDIVSLEKTDYYVLDEADEMYNESFFPQIREIETFMKPKEERVNMMLSATFPRQIQYLAKKHLRSGFVFLVIGILGGASQDISQEFVCASRIEKKPKLLKIIEEMEKSDKLLVFCNQRETVQSVAGFLHGKGIEPLVINSEMAQNERIDAVKQFDEGNNRVLVATSIAARGLNICNVQRIVNFDMPTTSEDYVQRIGRTGRLGKLGFAVSFYDDETDSEMVPKLKNILAGCRQPIPLFFQQENLELQKLMVDPDFCYQNEDSQRRFLRGTPQVSRVFDVQEDDWWG